MKSTIEEALKIAHTPTPVGCGECNELLYSLMDKLCITLYGKCSMHFESDSIEMNNLLKIAEAL
jgi:hypothetical protein